VSARLSLKEWTNAMAKLPKKFPSPELAYDNLKNASPKLISTIKSIIKKNFISLIETIIILMK
jgi:hypothetical protein